MWPASSRYFDTLARSHDQLIAIDILKGGDVAASLSNGFITDPDTGLRVSNIGGTINVDKTTIRRNGSAVFIDPSGMLLPNSVEDLFAPYTTELRISTGVRYWDAPITQPTYLATEFIPVATLVVTHIGNNYPQLTLEGYDRFWYCGNFQSPWVIPAGTTISDAIIQLLRLKVPAAVLDYDIPDLTETTTAALIYDADTSSAEAIHSLAENAGYTIYCDPTGKFVLTEEPSTDDEPIMTYQRGAFSTLLPRPSRSIGDAEMFNAVVLTSEGSTTAPIRGYAQDDNPASMTYVGSVGVHPTFVSDPSIYTQAAADRAAKRKLRSVLGISNTIAVPVIPNHALESGDVTQVIDDQQNLMTNLLVDSFSVPLRAQDGAQTLTCRSQVINVVS